MFGHFYNSSMRRYVVLMGSLLGNITVSRKRGDKVLLKQVPITWASKESFVRKLESRLGDSEDANHAQIETILPRMSLEMVDIAYDPMRNTSRVNRHVQRGAQPTETIGRYNPTPYKLTFQLSIYTRYQDDVFQIMEQIIPYFKPDFVCKIHEIHDGPAGKIGRTIPISLTSVVPIEDWDGGPSDRRRIEWTMTFIMDGWFYPPANDVKGEIRTVYLDFTQQERELDPAGNFESVDSELCTVEDGTVKNSKSTNIPIPKDPEPSGVRGKPGDCVEPGDNDE